jgi:hypothetical protein
MLVAVLVLAGAIGWAVGILLVGQFGRILPVPWLAAMTVWLIAIALGIWTLLSRPRLLKRVGHRPMPPLVAARSAALALAASRTGAVVAGFYLGLSIATVPQMSTPSGFVTFWAGLATSAGSVALIGAAMWLERLCRLRNHDDDPSAPSHA